MELNLLSSFDSFLDSISDALGVDAERRSQEHKKRGLKTASETLKTSLEAVTRRDANAVFQMLAHYERGFQEYHQTEDDSTYREIFWVFYEPAARTLDEIATCEGRPLLTDLIDVYSHESDGEPFVSPVIENTVGRHVARTRRCDDVEAVSAETLAYLSSLWGSNRDTSWGESFTYE